jgi:hypothetical protein
MHRGKSAGALAIATALSLLAIAVAANADEAKKYPDWNALWNRGSPPGVWDPSKPAGLGQEAPLTPEYQKIYEQTIAKTDAGLDFDIKTTCGPVGMPRLMIVYEPIEIVITPKVVYMLAESMSPIRRIFTDGRDWPKEPDPSFLGYSIGKWIDEDGDGRFDVLEVETRNFKGPRTLDPSGMPTHADNQSIVNERIYFDKNDPKLLINEITLTDHAFTRPWKVKKTYTRNPAQFPNWLEYDCIGDNGLVKVGNETYYKSSDGKLMPTRRDQPPPDLRYFKQVQK